jgi:hypothetical protein
MKCIYFNTDGINSYYLCPFACFFFLVATSYVLRDSEFPKNPFFQNIVVSFGEMLGIIPHLISVIIEYQTYKKTETNTKKPGKNLRFELEYNNSEDDIPKISFLQVIFLSFIDFLQSLFFFYGNYFTEYQFYFWSSHIFFLGIFTKYLLFKKLYIHHFISLVIFVILDVLHIIIVLMDDNKDLFKNIIFAFLLISNICLSFELVYEKKLMDYYFISVYKLCFLVGFFTFFFNLLGCIIMTIIARKLENKPDFIFDALEYFDNVNNTYSEIKTIIIYMLLTGLYNIFQFLTIKHLTPNHGLIVQILLAFYCSIMNKFSIEINNITYFLSLLCHSLCIVVFLFFLEIIELKCFGMDQETVHNISKRSDYDLRTVSSESIEMDENVNDSTISERTESI